MSDAEFRQTAWKMQVPEGRVLTHGTRISIQSLPVDKRTPTMSVYRNQQGVFSPTMTSNEGPSFWRILKTSKSPVDGDPIQDGEVVRLSWRFKDQTDGFRDFFDDAFGRRRYTKPGDVDDTLYLKVPFPRFEKTSSNGMALVMSPAATTSPIIETIKVLPTANEAAGGEVSMKYNLHDLSFRLDAIANRPSGAASDYMVAGIDQTNSASIRLGAHNIQVGDTVSIWQLEPVLSAPVKFIAETCLNVVG
ncbi:hypothetical protein B0H17DRAFT_1219980 [Mycena rosella]|uniref:Uncharacterized protein n=1 Tax=Mycena rosella TaxID=1033263 RepID=A0AAD7BDM5_MYCRO|nr:hypothetical protein B0H17DRAFT_1219980 [Mycena rosella]